MSTTNGNVKSFKVTDKDGNVYVMTPVDTEARQAIDEAKNLEFDEDYFTSEVSQDQKTVNIGLNGVPLGVDSDSPLKFVQDSDQGIVLGSDAPFATAIAPAYSASSTYALNSYCTYLGKQYRCSTAINTAEAWNAAHWTEVDTISSQAVKVYTFSGTSYPDADEIRDEKDKGKTIVLRKHSGSGSGDSDQYYYLDLYASGPGIPAGTGVQMDFYPVDNSRKFIRAFKDTTQSSPAWVWTLENVKVTLATAIAPEYDPTSTYPTVGTAVMYNGLRYVSNTAITTAEDWTAAHWTQTSVEDEIGNVEAKIGSVKDGGALTSAASVDVPNNAVSTLSTSEAALTLNVNLADGEIPNFAVEITAGAAITLTVTKTVNNVATTLNYSASAGNSLESGKLYQVTCVGSCWTLAEFTAPTP